VRRSLALLASFALLAEPVVAHACSCAEWSYDEALAHADLVAEVQILDVAEPIDSSRLGQPIRVRIVRTFEAPRGLNDGDELTVLHHTCTSEPYDRDAVGERFVGFFWVERGRMRFHVCSTTASAWAPLPVELRRARARWLESRR
jgi:hypothetical protein